MRKYQLDWLRVLVFLLLIFYHVGMLFVPWGFHIKNNIIYEWLVFPMRFLNQWRLPILFMISGMGTYYALSKRTSGQFALERVKRLFIPLAFGMLLIVPPQVYIERLVNNPLSIGSYFEYWPLDAFNGVYPEGNLSWHHLWFLPYLLAYSLILIPVFSYLKKHPDIFFVRSVTHLTKNPIWIYSYIVPLYFIETLIEPFFPITHALIDDWFNFINCMTLFFFGFILVLTKETFWEAVVKFRKQNLIVGALAFTAMLLLVRNYEDTTLRHFTEGFLKVLNLWAWILTLFGFATKYLNRESTLLKYANEAVYPFYILHQTVMMVLAYFVIDLDWTLGAKSTLLILGTFGISWMIYEGLIRKWNILRPFFGLKKIK